MKKVLYLILMICAAFNVFASVSISPFFVEFNAESRERSALVRIMNNTNKTKTYRIRLINYVQNPDGSYVKIEEALPCCPFADKYLAYSPRETTLAGGQSQTIRIQRKAMPTAAQGQYVSHLWVQEMPEKTEAVKEKVSNQIKINMQALYGVTIPIIIDKGDLKSSAQITKATVENTKDGFIVKVDLKQMGTKAFVGNLIVNENNKEIGRINEFRIFLSTPYRILSVPLMQKPKGNIQVILQKGGSDETISSMGI